jgi:hypothetical protein
MTISLVRAMASWFICWLSFCFAFVCFVPLYYHPSGSTANVTNGTDDYIAVFQNDPQFRQAALSCLIVAIPSCLDLLLDLIPSAWLFPGDYQVKLRSSSSSIFQLNLVERLLFVIGVASLAALSVNAQGSKFPPTVLFSCFANCNTILTIGPILSLFTRTAPTWHPVMTILLTCMVGAASFLNAFVSALTSKSMSMISDITLSSKIILNVASGLYVLMCVLAMINTFVRDVKYPDDDDEGKRKAGYMKNANSKRSASERGARNLVIASHAVATLAQFVLKSVWVWYAGSLSHYRLEILIYTVMAAAAVVFVTEFRMRKRQVTNALVRNNSQLIRLMASKFAR